MRVRVLGDPPTVRSLRLAGLAGRAVADPGEAGAVFEEMLAEEDLAVLLVTEPLAEAMRERVERAKLVRHFPLVVEIPARGTEMAPVDELVSQVAKLVGIRG